MNKSKSFYKDYPNRHDHRKQYESSDPRSVDPSCQNHGSCSSCAQTRRLKHTKRMAKYEADLKDYIENRDQ